MTSGTAAAIVMKLHEHGIVVGNMLRGIVY